MASPHSSSAKRRPTKRPVSSITDSRLAAAAILGELPRGMLLDQAFERHAGELEPRDRRWIQELVWGVLRRRGWLDAVISTRVKGGFGRLDDDVTDLLRLGIYQLVYMNSVPAYAAIAQTVEMAKRKRGIGASMLVNAVLRRVDREKDSLEPEVPQNSIEALAQQYSHPQWLVARWTEAFGAEDTELLLAANNREPPTFVRPYSVDAAELASILESEGVTCTPALLSAGSLELQRGVQLVDLGAFQQGQFFVQDPAATLVTNYAAIEKGSTVADLCAAPGGKTLELSRTALKVFASDRSPERLEKLLVGLGRLQAENIFAYVGDATQPALREVDAVLADVPCTGSGTMRRHPDARWRLKPSDVAVMASLQSEILLAASKSVKPGGLLVYSTCSLEREENDYVVDRFLARNSEFVLEPPPAGIVSEDVMDNGRLRVLPQKHGFDGAFAARMRRKESR